MSTKQHIVVIGNPVDGFSFFGPFESFEDAEWFGDRVDGEWWITDLTPLSSSLQRELRAPRFNVTRTEWPEDVECDECGRNDVVGCIGGTHYFCTRHEAEVTAMHAKDES
jgi:hypothetical protein